MDRNEYHQLILGIRKRGNLSRRRIAELMHEGLAKLATTTLQSDWIPAFENSGQTFHRSILGIEPNKTYYELFLNAIGPSEVEEGRIKEYIGSLRQESRITFPSEGRPLDYQI